MQNLLAPILFLLQSPQPLDTLAIDFSVKLRSTPIVGTGFLGPFYKNATMHPQNSRLLWDLNPSAIRVRPGALTNWNNADDVYSVAPVNTSIQAVLSDEMQDTYDQKPMCSGDYVSDSIRWDSVVRKFVNSIPIGKYPGLQYDILNEPGVSPGYFCSDTTLPNHGWDNFVTAWRIAYRAVRSIQPNAIIVGPSFSSFGNGNNIREFIKFCKSSNSCPNIISWHELDQMNSNVQVAYFLETHISEAIKIFSELGISMLPISINEYVRPDLPDREVDKFRGVDSLKPGKTIAYVSAINRNLNIVSALKSCWDTPQGDDDCEDGQIDGLLTQTEKKRGQWWLYRELGKVNGNILKIHPTKDNDAIAISESERLGSVFVCNLSGGNQSIPVKVNNFIKQNEVATVTATLYKIPYNTNGELGENGVIQLSTQLQVNKVNNSIVILLPPLAVEDVYLLKFAK